eukprot:gnl/TRDRNA2_/TRDRNA2_177704_c0_seq1.p1 gnl/TRDRNA2_/TRDRNA2_177704_c0~~gnl/TRDRNA2_/TRDRNA2_177704_c0_seq1.p1  ORF type:complete len:393 (+),score=59.09 gnl/TRDRNA2_/TRDRNA2_177704_c0_seq1:100-1179(+)
MARDDMSHFGIVCLSIFSCLCLCAVLMFGQDLEEFATIWRSLHTCFRIMFGDWNWQDMEEVRRVHAAIWFWSFMVIIVVILLNMLLAIIMDAYLEVKKNTSDAVTLTGQIKEMWRRHRGYKRGERVRLNDIYDAFAKEDPDELSMLNSDRLITAKFLLDLVPGIPANQASRGLKQAHQKHEKDNEPIFELEHSQKLLESIDCSTIECRDNLFYIQERVDWYDTLGSGSDSKAESDSRAEAAKPPVSDEALASVNDEIARLSGEMASVFAQSMKRVDIRQERLELRQKEMWSVARELHQTLQWLQSDAAGVTTKLLRYSHLRNQAGTAGRGGRTVPICGVCGVEAARPQMSISSAGLPSG